MARRPLPGLAAHMRLSPRPRPHWVPAEIPSAAVPAAVLALVFGSPVDAYVLLTLRSPDLPTHPGQVSFPGGVVEPFETIVDTALRESREEIGLDPADIEVVGTLTPVHIPVSGFALHPVVALRATRPSLVAEAGEVARILEVPVAQLLDPSRLRRRTRVRNGHQDEVPYFELEGGDQVWGATAMVLSELLDLLEYRPNAWA